jgi:hypothetical protein
MVLGGRGNSGPCRNSNFLTGKPQCSSAGTSKHWRKRRSTQAGPAYNLAEDAIFAWRRENPRPIWADHNNKEVEKIMRQVVDHIEQGGNLESFKLVAPVITEKTRAALGEVLQTIKLQNEWDRRERPQKLIAAAMRPRRNGARIAVRFVS